MIDGIHADTRPRWRAVLGSGRRLGNQAIAESFAEERSKLMLSALRTLDLHCS